MTNEDMRIILERTLLIPVRESDAAIILDEVKERFNNAIRLRVLDGRIKPSRSENTDEKIKEAVELLQRLTANPNDLILLNRVRDFVYTYKRETAQNVERVYCECPSCHATGKVEIFIRHR